MAISCATSDLAAGANCFMGYGPVILKAIQIRLACAFLNSEHVDCTVESLLADANCILSGLSPGQMDAVFTSLMCQLANAGGGGGSGCVTCSSTPPVAPPNIADCPCAITFGIGDWVGFYWVWDNGFTDTWVQVPGGP